eukprot:Cvel_23838.t1-p1 / transcript=Cvel_23838.t1 / gene=Cvel_23838 / organism=Chromera_velia_CCMP2878 / gene_product=hypothetical protein / transcript_product=hypothetical protein / location=Cvel_scaffold2506:26315-26954(+) / protein_length=59 / sequence_SO=supercontig / SO=protein_coding / is_pseudo=false
MHIYFFDFTLEPEVWFAVLTLQIKTLLETRLLGASVPLRVKATPQRTCRGLRNSSTRTG